MAEIIEPVKKKIKYVEEDSSSDSEAEVLFSLNDRIIKDAKDGKQYIKWKTLCIHQVRKTIFQRFGIQMHPSLLKEKLCSEDLYQL